ncbi:MAG: hypothetical protein GY841_13025 [FCB group bacterium]|nr:hypothetical protein [FCB group bacterium]
MMLRSSYIFNHKQSECMVCRVAVIVLLSLMTFGGVRAEVCGDVNDDDAVNVGDAVCLINYVFRGGPICDPITAADVNEDGSVNVGDAVYLIRYVFRDGAVPCPAFASDVQKVYFEVMYENYAWGYALNGIYIDSYGLVYSYSWEYGTDPWERGDTLTEEVLFTKYDRNSAVIGFLDPEFLEEKIAKIEGAEAGELSPPAFGCADFGINSYLAYTFDDATGIYNPVLLYQAGDVARKNGSPEALELFEWLTAWNDGAPICGYPDTTIEQKYLFDVTFINFAWGYTCRGFYIDNEGVVRSFDHSHEQWHPASDEGYTEAELADKYFYNNQQIGGVYKTILNAKFDLVDEAAEGPLSPRVNVCYDAGGVSFKAYQYDAVAELYRPVLLYTAGSWAQKNFAPEAIALLEWLQTYGYSNPACGYPE